MCLAGEPPLNGGPCLPNDNFLPGPTGDTMTVQMEVDGVVQASYDALLPTASIRDLPHTQAALEGPGDCKPDTFEIITLANDISYTDEPSFFETGDYGVFDFPPVTCDGASVVKIIFAAGNSVTFAEPSLFLFLKYFSFNFLLFGARSCLCTRIAVLCFWLHLSRLMPLAR